MRPIPSAGMSHQEMAQRVLDRVQPKLLLRVIPKPCMTGQLGPSHRAYVCLADYEELQGLPMREVVSRIYNGFGDNMDALIAEHPDAPFYDVKSYLFGEYGHIPPQCDAMKEKEFYVLAVEPSEELNCAPATWKAMALLATSHEQFPEPRIVNHYLERYKGFRPYRVSDFLHGLDYYEFTSFADERAVVASQMDAYRYLSSTDLSIHEVVEFFGVSALCWHGCGYIGPGFHILSRVFFGKNLAISHESIRSCHLLTIEDDLPLIVPPSSPVAFNQETHL